MMITLLINNYSLKFNLLLLIVPINAFMNVKYYLAMHTHKFLWHIMAYSNSQMGLLTGIQNH